MQAVVKKKRRTIKIVRIGQDVDADAVEDGTRTVIRTTISFRTNKVVSGRVISSLITAGAIRVSGKSVLKKKAGAKAYAANSWVVTR